MSRKEVPRYFYFYAIISCYLRYHNASTSGSYHQKFGCEMKLTYLNAAQGQVYEHTALAYSAALAYLSSRNFKP